MGDATHDFYEKNISLLQEKHKSILAWLNEYPPEPAGEAVVSETGRYNLKIETPEGKTLFLHDRKDPEREVDQFLRMVAPDSRGTVVFQGMGLGYGPVGVIEKRSDIRHLIIFEPCPEIFIQALRYSDLTPLFKDPRVSFSIGPQPNIGATLAIAGRNMRLEDVVLLTHNPSFTYREAENKKLKKAIHDAAVSYSISAGTFKAFGSTFISNRLSFLTMIRHTALIDSLRSVFKGMPALLVAAGPSLNKNIHLINEFKDKAVIISVDSSLPTLMAKGIIPDIVTAIDYRGVTYEKIAPCITKKPDVSLICSSWVCKKVPKMFPAKNVFWTFTNSPMERWINNGLGGKLISPGAGTVGQMSIVAAIIMGCSPIIFAGQDLSFSADAGVSDHSDNTVVRSNKKSAALLKDKKNLQWVEANYGGKLPATIQHINHKHNFEGIIANNPGLYINATEGGAYIKGTEVETLQYVLDNHCREDLDISGKMKRINREDRMENVDPFLANVKSIVKRGNTLARIIRKAENISLFLRKELESIRKSSVGCRGFQDLPNKLQRKIKELDKCHNKADQDNAFWELFDEATFNELQSTDRMRQDVDKLKDSPDRYLEWLLGHLDRLDEVNRIRKGLATGFKKDMTHVINHHKTEKKLLKAIESPGKSPDWVAEKLMEAVRLYMNTEDVILAKPLLERVQSIDPDLPELNFYQGIVSAHYTEFEKAADYFGKAVEKDPAYSKRVEAFRRKMGDEYLEYVVFARDMDENTYKMMVLKGLRYCADHPELQENLVAVIETDLGKINGLNAQKRPDAIGKIISEWEDRLALSPEFLPHLDKQVLGKLYGYMGKYFLLRRDFIKTAEYLHKAVSCEPGNAEYYLLLADLLFALGKDEQAVLQYRKAAEINPGFVQNYEASGQGICKRFMAQGNQLYLNRQFARAIGCYEKVLALNPGHVEAVHNIGGSLKELGEIQKAMAYYEEALKLDSTYHKAYFSMGTLLKEQGKIPEAIQAFQKAVQAKPDFIEALNNLGAVLNYAGLTAEAVKCFKRIFELNPSFDAALNNLGVVYQKMGRLEESVEYFKLFLERQPHNPEALANIIDQLQYACAWEDLDRYRQHAEPLNIKAFETNGKPVEKPMQSLRVTADPKRQLMVARAFAPVPKGRMLRRTPEDVQRRSQKEKLRIGYISTDFRDHPVGHIMSSFLQYHDKSAFDIYCYSSGIDDGSVYQKLAREHAAAFVEIRGMGHDEAAQRIMADDIDVLVEMNGFTMGSRLEICARRPAPVQVSYLGFLGTTGAEYMDYVITDAVVTPEDQAPYYTEEFAYLPDCYQVTDYSHQVSDKVYQRKDFGLPEEGVVFCSFNQPYKFEPVMFDIWMKIMNQVPGSVLWMRRPSKTAEKNLRAYAQQNQVDPSRLIFSSKIPLHDHIKRLELADIALDTRIYNGGATTNNALWAGVPVVTLQGTSLVSRMSSSTLTALGMPGLVTRSPAEYEALAVKLASDKAELKAVKARISENKGKTPLYDLPGFVKNLETLYTKMMEVYLTL